VALVIGRAEILCAPNWLDMSHNSEAVDRTCGSSEGCSGLFLSGLTSNIVSDLGNKMGPDQAGLHAYFGGTGLILRSCEWL